MLKKVVQLSFFEAGNIASLDVQTAFWISFHKVTLYRNRNIKLEKQKFKNILTD